MNEHPESAAKSGDDAIYQANVRRIFRAAYDKHVLAPARHEAALREQRIEQARVEPQAWAEAWNRTQSILQDLRESHRAIR